MNLTNAEVVRDSIKSHCDKLGLAHIFTVAAMSVGVAEYHRGSSPALSIGRGKSAAEAYRSRTYQPSWRVVQ